MDEFNCPVRITTEILGGKWKPLILYFLRDRICRFGELQKLMPRATKKMLAQKLRELEGDDIVRRKVYAQMPPRVEYSLTRHGQSLRPILELMASWGTEHRARHGRARK